MAHSLLSRILTQKLMQSVLYALVRDSGCMQLLHTQTMHMLLQINNIKSGIIYLVTFCWNEKHKWKFYP